MATYRFLTPHLIAGVYYEAGTTAKTSDAGGTLPIGWTPSGQVDPLDNAAVSAFFAVGIQRSGLVRQQWSTLAVAGPVTYWKAVNADQSLWSLTGLGASLGVVSWTTEKGAMP